MDQTARVRLRATVAQLSVDVARIGSLAAGSAKCLTISVPSALPVDTSLRWAVGIAGFRGGEVRPWYTCLIAVGPFQTPVSRWLSAGKIHFLASAGNCP